MYEFFTTLLWMTVFSVQVLTNFAVIS